MRQIKTVILLLMAALLLASPFDADAARRKTKKRKRARTTKVVKPVKQAPLPAGIAPGQRFIEFTRDYPAPTRGLDGRNIAVWQSHGRFYDEGRGVWTWQRPRLFGTVEDLFPQGFVLPFLNPMLENAGAYVLSPRERDTSTIEIIADSDGDGNGRFAVENGAEKWTESKRGTGFANDRAVLHNGDNPFLTGTYFETPTITPAEAAKEKVSYATWNASLPRRGSFAVYVSYASLPNSATDARFTVNHLGGSTEVTVNQRMGGGTWIYLGHYELAKGWQKEPVVELSNISSDKDAVVTADAVKIGGGMGNVARGTKDAFGNYTVFPETSSSPRFNEGARYWLQWAGMPQKVYDVPDENDYKDDYKSRAYWVNYLAGGSLMLPDSAGLKIPVDLAFAFHTDAGSREDGSRIGTLGIYSTDSGTKLGNGRNRWECKELTDEVTGSVISDIRALYDPLWPSRGNKDAKYFEIRETKVPAMIIELLSHQNFEDMKLGLNPEFRFDVSRAIYKGILRFISKRHNTPYTVQPLPVNDFAISAEGSGNYTLSWRPTYDKLEETAYPTFYVVEERVNDGAFSAVATVKEPSWSVKVTDGDIHSYRIVAGNAGGVAFPSETLSLYDNHGKMPEVIVVNGFTRLSGPDWFDVGDYAGFDYAKDGGVAYREDIITTGAQYDFLVSSPYYNNDNAGFGASRGNREKMVFAGNTFDYPYIHGLSIKAASRGFISASASAFAKGEPARLPKVVDLILGKQKEVQPGEASQGTRHKTFPPSLQQRLTAHCHSGGSVLVSGAYVATDLFANSYSDEATRQADAAFARDVLGYEWKMDKATVSGTAHCLPTHLVTLAPANLRFQTTSGVDSYAVESPDALTPSATDAVPVIIYDENSLTAATAMVRTEAKPSDSHSAAAPTTYRTVVIGFPFESIDGAENRAVLMRSLLDFLK